MCLRDASNIIFRGKLIALNAYVERRMVKIQSLSQEVKEKGGYHIKPKKAGRMKYRS